MAIANFSCSQQWYGGMMMGDQQGIRPGTYSMIDFRMPAILTGINKVNLTVHTSFGTPTVAIYFYSGTCTGAMCTTHMEIDVNGVGQSYDNVPVYSSFWKAAGTWRVTIEYK